MMVRPRGFWCGLVVLLVVVLQAGCSTLVQPKLEVPFDGNVKPISDYLTKLIKREMNDGDLTGLSIALIDQSEIVWSEGFGFADKQNEILASVDTVYRAGSISKLFNAIAVMQLAEQKLLELDKAVASYVPDFSVNSRFGSTDAINLRNLLSHQSGLPSDIVAGMWSSDPEPANSLLPMLAESYTVNPPNTLFSYSNVGISLSGQAVQSVSEMPYEAYIHQHVLMPLGMTDSDFTGRVDAKRMAKAYKQGVQLEELPLRDIAAGGLNTTVEDLSRFVVAMHNHGSPLIKKDTFDQMLQVQNKNGTIDLGARVGLGWLYEHNKIAGRYDVIWHGGRTIAHSSRLTTSPELGIGVVILSNSADDSDALGRISREAMELLYKMQGNRLPEYLGENLNYPNLKVSPDLQGDYAGMLGLLEIKKNGKHYQAEVLGTTVSLRQEANDWYSPRIMFGFIPLRPKDIRSIRVSQATINGKQRLVGIDKGNPFLLGDLIEPYPSSNSWDKHLGEYKLRNPVEVDEWTPTAINFKRAKNFYYLEIVDAQGTVMKTPVRPLNERQFVLLGTGRGLGGTMTLIGPARDSTFTLSGLIYERQRVPHSAEKKT